MDRYEEPCRWEHDALPRGGRCRRCGYVEGKMVDCDVDCNALLEPTTFEEALAAATHWRSHSLRSGCSHGH